MLGVLVTNQPDAEGVCNGLEPTTMPPRPPATKPLLLSPITKALPEGESNADLAVKYAYVAFRAVCWKDVKECNRGWWFSECVCMCAWAKIWVCESKYEERREWGDYDKCVGKCMSGHGMWELVLFECVCVCIPEPWKTISWLLGKEYNLHWSTSHLPIAVVVVVPVNNDLTMLLCFSQVWHGHLPMHLTTLLVHDTLWDVIQGRFCLENKGLRVRVRVYKHVC
jgi:hypothetical protein